MKTTYPARELSQKAVGSPPSCRTCVAFKHALCVYPYRNELGPRTRFYPPLGLEIIATRLEPYCRAIDVVDLRRESERTKDFLREDTDLVCFSVNWGLERRFVREEIRSVPGHIRTVVGGRHATEDPEWWLRECPNIDVLVRGDGEDTIKELAENRSFEHVTGVSYRLNGHFVHNPVGRCPPVKDDFFPNRRLRQYEYTVDMPEFRTGLTFDSVATSLGCPHNCRFCTFNRNPWGAKRRWSARSPESVVRELEELEAKVVFFVDDNFTHDMDRVAAICELILERGIRKKCFTNARIEVARRPDVLRKMERAGFWALGFGIESAQDKTLRSMRKGFHTKKVREYFRVLKKSRMILHGNFIVGNIGESEEEMLEIVRFARELGVDTLSAKLLRHERYSALKELVEQAPGYHIDPDGKVFSDRYPVEDLRRIRDRIVRSFYTPSQLLRIGKKVVQNRIFTPRMVASLPGLLLRAIGGRFDPEYGRGL